MHMCVCVSLDPSTTVPPSDLTLCRGTAEVLRGGSFPTRFSQRWDTLLYLQWSGHIPTPRVLVNMTWTQKCRHRRAAWQRYCEFSSVCLKHTLLAVQSLRQYFYPTQSILFLLFIVFRQLSLLNSGWAWCSRIPVETDICGFTDCFSKTVMLTTNCLPTFYRNA